MSREKIASLSQKESPSKDSVHAQLESLQEELKKNPKSPEIRSQIAVLRRELNRAKKFTEVKKPESEKIIGKKGFDSLNASELLKIDKEEGERGTFLSKTFLYKQTKDESGNIYEESTDGKNMKEGDVLLVDFGKNASANRQIGLGHMLPVSVEYVKVNGRLGIRTIINNRVGYYENPSPKGYIPVFTGDTVTIPTKAEIEAFEKSKNVGLTKNTDQKATDDANDAYIERLENTSVDAVEINTHARESYDFWKSKKLPHHVAAAIVGNEFRESSFNPRAHNKTDKEDSYGIFQWSIDRRQKILAGTGKDMHQANHREQLEAAYWELTNAYAHVLAKLQSSKDAREAAKIFAEEYEVCAKMHVPGRMDAAESYGFLLDPENRSYNLGDHIVRRGPAKTGEYSCGAAVRELLQSYGITGLPTSGAHGKTWNETLDKMPEKFVRVKISHPREAYPGAILVYDGGSTGSSMNQEYGHVEIKGSDGRYYSYYASENAGGSAKSSDPNTERYKIATGFTGYAYYPREVKS